jgi:membrane protease YdiL (CAAX protease family)
VIYLALPLASLLLLRLRPGQVGFAWGRPRQWLTDTGLLYAAMVPLLIIAARLPAFRHAYPYFGFERHGLALVCLGLGTRLFGMFAWEFLFRGYLLFGFERRIGPAPAVAVTTIPFVLMHFGKPLPETLGAAVAGVALGIVALRSRSFIPCAILHWSVAATLDLLALHV